MLYSRTHMATVGVKGLRRTCMPWSRRQRTCAVAVSDKYRDCGRSVAADRRRGI